MHTPLFAFNLSSVFTTIDHHCTADNCMYYAGKDRFMALKASYLATGLTTRIHGNVRRTPKHALKLYEVKNLVTFLNNFAEKNAILLPGRIPGYKRDDLQLLPSNTTKKVSTLKEREREKAYKN